MPRAGAGLAEGGVCGKRQRSGSERRRGLLEGAPSVTQQAAQVSTGNFEACISLWERDSFDSNGPSVSLSCH